MKRFGLIGKKLEHSFSKKYFTEKFSNEGLNCIYENYELQEIGGLATLIASLPDLKGLNVTIPFKESVIQFLDERNELVKESGACNCISIKQGKLTGFNTDIPAFENSILRYLQPHHTSALVLGSGGASLAVQFVLKKLHLPFQVVSRKKENTFLSYDVLTPEIIQQKKIIVNTTPLGMYPATENAPPVPYGAISSHHLLYDLVYNPSLTKFLLQGQQKGATIVNGYEMLVLQAEESWKIWKMVDY